MHVGIIGGTGPAGLGLAARLAAGGHKVTVGSRTATRAKEHVDDLLDAWPAMDLQLFADDNEEAANAEVVVLATPWDAAVATSRSLEERLRGKLLVSMCNALHKVGDEFQPLVLARGSVAESLAKALPKTHVGAAFHHLPARMLATLDSPMDADVLVVGDDDEATQGTFDLVASIAGLRPVVAGSLSMAGAIESFTAVLLNVNVRHKSRSAVKLTGLK